MSDPTSELPDEIDALARRVADCLEQHLPNFGFEPYRYPSGENKSVDLTRGGEVLLFDAGGRSWVLTLAPMRGMSNPLAGGEG